MIFTNNYNILTIFYYKKRIIFIVASLVTLLLVLLLLRVNWDTVKDEASMLGLHRREVQGIRVSGMAIYLSREHDVNYFHRR